MVQRIQTLFLLAATALLSLLFFIPSASYIIEPQMEKFFFRVVGLVSEGDAETIFSPWALLILTSIATLLSFIIIFFYKKRILQIRLCIMNIIILAGLQGLLLYYVISIGKSLNSSPDYNFVFIIPIVAVIFTYLATRAIAKDEALIRSLNHLR